MIHRAVERMEEVRKPEWRRALAREKMKMINFQYQSSLAITCSIVIWSLNELLRDYSPLGPFASLNLVVPPVEVENRANTRFVL